MNILEARRRLLGRNVYKRTTDGNPAIAQGSLARMYPGITMQGWTTQDGTPTPETPVPIVSAGTQNQDTGKWEYEIAIANKQTDPDKNQTVTLTADRPLTKWDKLEKRNGQWGWVYKSAEIVLDGDESVGDAGGAVMTTIPFRINGIKGVLNSVGTIATFSDKLQGISNSNWNNGNAQGVYLMNDGQLNVRINASYLSTSERSEYTQAFKEWLSENNVKVLYETAEETFVPLTASEQEAMNALYTFRPTTVLSNDCGCNMTLTYKTKKSMGGVGECIILKKEKEL